MAGSDHAAQPTPYPDVNSVLRELLVVIRAALGANFVGLYVYGSLAQGDFDPASSDLDLMVVTGGEVTAAQFAALGALHAAFRAGDSPWADKIEVAYIARDALDRPRSHLASYPQLEKDRALAREPLELGWPFQRHVLREQGIVVAGPAPPTLMAPVAPQELAAAALAIVHMWQVQRRDDPTWLPWARRRESQRFVLVTLCRSLYTLEHGTLASKAAAARWAQESLDGRWAALMSASLSASGDVTAGELAETLAFLDYTAERLTGAAGA